MTNAELTTALEEFKAETDARIVALGERVAVLEAGNAASVDAPSEYLEAIDKLHVQLFGVPVGGLQSLKD